MRALVRCAVRVGLLGGILCSGLRAQILHAVKDAPFQAVQTTTRVDSTGTHITTGIIARRSDGSIFQELMDPAGHGVIFANDQTKKTSFQLYPDKLLQGKRIYTMGTNVGPPEVQRLPDGYTEAYARQMGPAGTQSAQGTVRTSSLGTKEIEGIETVGRKDVVADGRVVIHWYAPGLDLDLEWTGEYPSMNSTSETHVDHLRLGEPDAELFEVPDGYLRVDMVKGRVKPYEPLSGQDSERGR